jgi:hypothetical protein
MTIKTDSEIIAAIREYGIDHTANTLGRLIGVGAIRLQKIAAQNNLHLRKQRKFVNDKDLRMRQIDGYWIKLCPSCEQWLGVEFYHSDESRPSGFHSWCRECANGRRRMRDALRRMNEAFL